MLIKIQSGWVNQLQFKSQAIKDAVRHKNEKQLVEIDLRMLSSSEIASLKAHAEKMKGPNWKATINAIDTRNLMLENPSGTTVDDLRLLVDAFTAHFLKTEHRWVFAVELQHRVPYFVEKIEYHKAKTEDRIYRPAYVQMTLKANGLQEHQIWHATDLPGRTVPKLLAMKGLRTESPELYEGYEAEMLMYKECLNNIGGQYSATGTAYIQGEYSWSVSTIAMEREGKPTRIVIDDDSELKDSNDRSSRRRMRSNDEEKIAFANNDFWQRAKDPNFAGKSKDKYRFSDDDDDEDQLHAVDPDAIPDQALPTHPWLRAFDLVQHQHISIHVGDVEPYEYKPEIADKLILPQDSLEVMKSLINAADNVMEDIVAGKTGGTIVIATGLPGTGKTLTAEVFSEMVKKPLYVVQCSQLGTSPDELEKKLALVLSRATRWKAILLIDEADVYVRHRGGEIAQNAIVGVWLRVLEYYRGILFMTSNKATEIDDAVMSRATAWVRYELPNREEAIQLWGVLAAQYEVKLSTTEIQELVRSFPKASGRNIKNLLKLGKQLRKDGSAIDAFKKAARFLDVPVGQAGKPSGEWDGK